MTDTPFPKNASLRGSSLEHLRDWLSLHVPEGHLLTPHYSVGDLVNDLDSMLDGMWSDGIDAMGEDA